MVHYSFPRDQTSISGQVIKMVQLLVEIQGHAYRYMMTAPSTDAIYVIRKFGKYRKNMIVYEYGTDIPKTKIKGVKKLCTCMVLKTNNKVWQEYDSTASYYDKLTYNPNNRTVYSLKGDRIGEQFYTKSTKKWSWLYKD